MAVTEAAVAPASVALARPAGGARKWFAFGTGAGVEIDGDALVAVVARVRPTGVEVLGTTRIERFTDRPATEWGAELADFLRRLGVGKLPLTVTLPREHVIVRTLALPGVNESDMASAVAFQVDSLHPWPEETAAHAWARIGESASVLIGIAQREIVDHYANLFSEAGLRLGRFVFPAAACYSAARVTVDPPAAYLSSHPTPAGFLVFGESASRPVFSGYFDFASQRALDLAASELRLDAEAPRGPITALLPVPGKAPADFDASRHLLAYAAALMSACPRGALDANLLPEDRRDIRTWLRYAPTLVLCLLLAAAAGAWAMLDSLQQKRYAEKLQAEIARVEKPAARAAELDAARQVSERRIEILIRHRARTRADIDALSEVTKLLAPPAWLQSFQMTRSNVILSGESDQSAGYIKVMDDSPLFTESSFAQSVTRIGSGESFIIRANREGAGTGMEAGETR